MYAYMHMYVCVYIYIYTYICGPKTKAPLAETRPASTSAQVAYNVIKVYVCRLY